MQAWHLVNDSARGKKAAFEGGGNKRERISVITKNES